MSFRELDIQPCYDSGRDDVLNGFYLPVLGESIEYVRLAGYFSSTAFAVAAKGIAGLLENDGRMKLIAGAVLRKKDVDAIRDGLENPSEVIERVAMEDFCSMEDEFVRNHVRALGWMIAEGRLEIRVAVVKDRGGSPLDETSVLRSGIFHQKIGIFTDNEGQMISFSGSVNETARAWIENVEEFKVFRSWIGGEYEHFRSDCEMFNRYWNGETDRVEVLEIPDAVRKHLIQMAPDNLDMLDLDWKPHETTVEDNNSEEVWGDDQPRKFNESIEIDINRLRDYQQEAIDNWRSNSWRGILEMATASGKTFTAIMGSYYLFKEIGKLCTVVLVPSKQLVKQWGKELKKYTDNVVLISSDEKNWKAMVNDFVSLFRMGSVDHLYIVSTIRSYTNSAEKMLLKIPSQQKLLIVDEAHWVGAVEAQTHFKGTAPIRALGLTATPVRYFDEEGTDFLYSFLGDVVFKFTIKDGQDRGYLCKYNYHVEFCDLDRLELREYIRLTKSIVMEYGNEDKKKLTMLLNKRAKVVKDAKSKFKGFDRLLSKLKGEIDRCVVYCDENQIDTICTILREHDLIFNTFLGTTPDHERQRLISKLTSGMIDVIVAIKCLNEGVDIPPLKMGFFISSSGNPKEFIQRRGRLLRVCEGKNVVDMYDFVVAPDVDQLNLAEPEKKAQDKIIKKELDRVKEFNDNALNSAVNEQKILERLNMIL